MHITKRIFTIGLSFLLLFLFSISTFADGTDEIVATTAPGTPTVSAKSMILMEATTGQILMENASNEKMPVSYLVKLMTLLLTMEAINANKFTFETMITTSANANAIGDPKIWLNKGEQISVDELLKSITVGNANDACVALAEAVAGNEQEFVSLMNLKASQLGMKNTAFLNSTGIECEGQYSSAYDVALLAKELLKYEKLTPYLTTWMVDVRAGSTNLVNTNLLVRSFNGITGMKAATSTAAGNCLVATAKRNDLNLICVMLGCPSKDQRFVDAKSILNYAFSINDIFSPNIKSELLKPISVKGGEINKVDISIEKTSSLVIPKGTSKNIQTKILLENTLNAPIMKGQVVGKVQFFDGDKLVLETNVITKKEVNKMSMKIALQKLLENLLNF